MDALEYIEGYMDEKRHISWKEAIYFVKQCGLHKEFIDSPDFSPYGRINGDRLLNWTGY